MTGVPGIASAPGRGSAGLRSPGNKVFALSALPLLVITLIGLLLALLLPAPQTAVPAAAPAKEHAG